MLATRLTQYLWLLSLSPLSSPNPKHFSSTRPWLPFPPASMPIKTGHFGGAFSWFFLSSWFPPSLSLLSSPCESYVFLSSPLLLCPKLHLLSWPSFAWTLPLTSTIKTFPSAIPRRGYVPVLILSPWTEPPSYSSLLWSQ